jgi:hypothetical protein
VGETSQLTRVDFAGQVGDHDDGRGDVAMNKNLDRAIADTIGMVSTHKVLGSDIEFFADPRSPREVARTFNPSIDLNDAFYAAESVGLFEDSQRVLRKDTLDATWEIVDMLASSEVILVSEDTPALAICSAILKTMDGKEL